MWLLILEALAALGVLVFIVWWTMFAGRRREAEPAVEPTANPAADSAADAPRGPGAGRDESRPG